jgi:hypothetical protein
MVQPPATPPAHGAAMGDRLAGLKAQAAQARVAVALAFSIGVLIGWVVLGWWLFPVHWTNTTPADLAPEYQATYVQLVADAYVRDGDLAAAQAALAGFDAATLTATLETLGASTEDPNQAQAARTLETALATSRATAITASATPTSDAGAASGASLAGLTRSLAWIALIAALGAGLALLGVWLWQRRQIPAAAVGSPPMYDFEAVRMAGAGATVAAGLSTEGEPPVPAPAPLADATLPGVVALDAGTPGSGTPGSGTPGAGMPAAGVLSAAAVVAAVPEESGNAVTWAKPSTGPRRVLPAAVSPAAEGQSERIKLGQTVRARYRANQPPARQSWLIHDPQGELIGGAGWNVHRVGNINTIDFRTSDRDDLDQTTKTPIVRFVAPAAYSDAILHGRLSGPQLVPAVRGESVTLRTVDLVLDVTVEAAEPEPESPDTGLTALTLSFTPHRNQPDHSALFQSDADVVWEDADAEDAFDDAFGPEPRPPLKFRRD